MSGPNLNSAPRLVGLALEDRIVPATISWDGGGDNTTWTDARNWVGDVLPGSADDAVLGVDANLDIVVTGNIAVRSIRALDNLELRSGSLTTALGIAQQNRTLKLTSGTISAGTGVALGAGTTLRIEAGNNTVVGTVALGNDSLVSLADGIAGTANFRIADTAAKFSGFLGERQTVDVVGSNASSGVLQVASGRTLVNRGTISLSTTGTQATQIRIAGGGLLVNADSGLLEYAINTGTGASFLSGSVDNFGRIRIRSGTILENTDAVPATLRNFGIVRLDAGIDDIGTSVVNSAGAYIGGSGTLSRAGSVSLTDNGTIDSTGPALADIQVGASTIRVVLTDAVGFAASTLTNPANYRLLRSGGDTAFGDANDVDLMPSVSSIAYDAPTMTATLTFPMALPGDLYRLTLKAASILNSASVPLNPSDIAAVLLPGSLPASATVVLLPASDTGFSSSDRLTNATSQQFGVFTSRGGVATFDGNGDGTPESTASTFAASYLVRTTALGAGTFSPSARIVVGSQTGIGTTTVTIDLTAPTATDSRGSIVAPSVQSRTVAFGEAIDPTTMIAANVAVTGPGGALAVTSIVGSGSSWTIGFTPSSIPGNYQIRFSAAVRDLAGNAIDPMRDVESFALTLPTPAPTPTPVPAPTPTPTPVPVPTPTPVVPSSSRLPSDVAIGNSAGDLPILRVFAADGTLKSTLMPFASSFRGGVRTAVADFDGDGIGDIAVATGPGGAPHVKVIRGSDGAELLSFYAYDPSFSGGVFVAAGDVNGDGIPDIVTGTGAGSGPHVRAFDGRTGAELLSFFAYDPSFRGGVRVAVGDIDGDGRNDIVTTPEFGAPHVKAFGGPGLREIRSFFAYDSAFLGGVSLAVADVDGDGFGDILTGIAANGPSHTKLFDGRTGAERASFFAYDPAYDGGEQVAFVRSGGRAKIVTVSRGPAHTRIFDAMTLGENASFYAQRDGLPSVTL